MLQTKKIPASIKRENNRICKLLGTEYPIIQGGMAWVANAELASAVSNAGGLGIIAAAATPPEILEQEIIKAKKLLLPGKPFGLNIMLMSPTAESALEVAVKHKVPVVTTGAGSPGKFSVSIILKSNCCRTEAKILRVMTLYLLRVN